VRAILEEKTKSMDSDHLLNENSWTDVIRLHYASVWQETPVVHRFNRGPVNELPADFRVLEFAPSKRSFWIYATCGMSRPSDENLVELHLFSQVQCESHVELLTIVAHYHRTGRMLDLAHIVNFGRPWMNASQCEYGLISLPYLDGPALETLWTPAAIVKFYWLLPITQQEKEFATLNGLDALEELFERVSFDYLDPHRSSVV
jgi:Suppressor of fused protein (SUFU)